MIFASREDVTRLTSRWEGERFADGRPRVDDGILARIRNVTAEEAWNPLWHNGYKQQFQGVFRRTHSDVRLLGRAVTVVMVPSRPDVHMDLLSYGHQELGKHGFFSQWVIDDMQPGDVLVVDMCDKVFQGTFLGGNLSTAIQARTQTGGAVIWGGIRDLEQIAQMKDFQVYYRGCDPTPIQDMMLSAVNTPCNIGGAICMPGDVVLGTVSGVTFIPAHMAESVAVVGEKQQVKDIFGFQRLREQAYLSSQLDAAIWSSEVMADFMQWLSSSPEAEPFRHLCWEEEMEQSKNVGRYEFTGLS